jgi:hypothetical protein
MYPSSLSKKVIEAARASPLTGIGMLAAQHNPG